jgi:hypothetical protein
MTINTILEDGRGTGNRVKISDEGELHVVVHNHPPDEESTLAEPLREFLTNSAGASDMRVDGSTTNVIFSIEADAEKDIYIRSLSFVIADASATLNKFGNLAALTNGCVLAWSNQSLGETIIGDNLTTNFEFVRLCLGNPSFGDGTAAFRAGNVAGASEGYIPVLNFQDVFGMDYGIRLRRGTTDKITLTIRDNVSGVDQFNAIAYGIKFKAK